MYLLHLILVCCSCPLFLPPLLPTTSGTQTGDSTALQTLLTAPLINQLPLAHRQGIALCYPGQVQQASAASKLKQVIPIWRL